MFNDTPCCYAVYRPEWYPLKKGDSRRDHDRLTLATFLMDMLSTTMGSKVFSEHELWEFHMDFKDGQIQIYPSWTYAFYSPRKTDGVTCSQRNPTEADLRLSVPFNRENVSRTVSEYKQWISQSDIHDSCTAEMDDVQKKKRSTKHSPFYQTKSFFKHNLCLSWPPKESNPKGSPSVS